MRKAIAIFPKDSVLHLEEFTSHESLQYVFDT